MLLVLTGFGKSSVALCKGEFIRGIENHCTTSNENKSKTVNP